MSDVKKLRERVVGKRAGDRLMIGAGISPSGEACNDVETRERPAVDGRVERVSVRTAANRSIPAATAVTQLAMKRRLRFAIPRAAGASAISTGASSH